MDWNDMKGRPKKVRAPEIDVMSKARAHTMDDLITLLKRADAAQAKQLRRGMVLFAIAGFFLALPFLLSVILPGGDIVPDRTLHTGLLALLYLRIAVTAWRVWRRFAGGLAIALAVFSHFVLDWLTHIPELPLLGDDSLKIGLGLWDNLPLALALEVALVAIGFIFYLNMVKPKTNRARYGIGGLLLFTSAMTVVGKIFAQTAPPVNAAAITWILQPLLLGGLAFWFDKGA